MLNRVTNLLRARTDGYIHKPSVATFWPTNQADAPPSDTTPDCARPTRRYRTLWISDTHLGTAGCQAFYLLDFLKHNESDTRYLVSDIIDGWQFRRGWY